MKKFFSFIILFAVMSAVGIVFSGCESSSVPEGSSDAEKSSSASESSLPAESGTENVSEYYIGEPEARTPEELLESWERVMAQEEFDVKLYQPYGFATEIFSSQSNFPACYSPTQEWYDNAEKAINFLKPYDLEFELVSEDELSYSDWAKEGVFNSIVLRFYSGGDEENILELHAMIFVDGSVILKGFIGTCELRSTTKVDLEEFIKLFNIDTQHVA